MTLFRTKVATKPRPKKVRAEAVPQNEAADATVAIATRHLSIILGPLALNRSSFGELRPIAFDLGSYWYGWHFNRPHRSSYMDTQFSILTDLPALPLRVKQMKSPTDDL